MTISTERIKELLEQCERVQMPEQAALLKELLEYREAEEQSMQSRDAVAGAGPHSQPGDLSNYYSAEARTALEIETGRLRSVFCGMCGDTGLQNGVKCPQILCRKANGLYPFNASPLSTQELYDQAMQHLMERRGYSRPEAAYTLKCWDPEQILMEKIERLRTPLEIETGATHEGK